MIFLKYRMWETLNLSTNKESKKQIDNKCPQKSFNKKVFTKSFHKKCPQREEGERKESGR